MSGALIYVAKNEAMGIELSVNALPQDQYYDT
jgi:hypothetical protein